MYIKEARYKLLKLHDIDWGIFLIHFCVIEFYKCKCLKMENSKNKFGYEDIDNNHLKIDFFSFFMWLFEEKLGEGHSFSPF